MKNTIKILVVVGVLIILGLAVFLVISSNKKETFDESKAIDMGISNTISYIDNCLAVKDIPMANRSELMRGCPDSEGFNINQTGLEKLKLIENLKGIPVNISLSGCNLIYDFDYQDVIVRLVYHSISLYDCNSKYYLVLTETPAPNEKYYQIKLNEDLINKLKK